MITGFFSLAPFIPKCSLVYPKIKLWPAVKTEMSFLSLYSVFSTIYACGCSYLKTSLNLRCSQEKLDYKRSRTIISVYPSKFCPFHFVLSNLSGSIIDSPTLQIRSFTAHSANIASPVNLSLSFKSSFCENFAKSPS